MTQKWLGGKNLKIDIREQQQNRKMKKNKKCPVLIRGSIFDCCISLESSFQELSNEV